jgi:hypothetical protein
MNTVPNELWTPTKKTQAENMCTPKWNIHLLSFLKKTKDNSLWSSGNIQNIISVLSSVPRNATNRNRLVDWLTEEVDRFGVKCNCVKYMYIAPITSRKLSATQKPVLLLYKWVSAADWNNLYFQREIQEFYPTHVATNIKIMALLMKLNGS